MLKKKKNILEINGYSVIAIVSELSVTYLTWAVIGCRQNESRING